MLVDFRPINLYNIIYKIIVKIYSSKLSVILPNIISPNQVGFVKGRSITDNAIIGMGIMHHIYSKSQF